MEFNIAMTMGGIQRADFTGRTLTGRFQWADSNGQISVGGLYNRQILVGRFQRADLNSTGRIQQVDLLTFALSRLQQSCT